MSETTRPTDARTADRDAAAVEAPRGFELLVETRPPGLVRRFFTTVRHFGGMFGGGLVAWVRARREARENHGFAYRSAAFAAILARPFLRKDLVALPFPVQFRRRLEILGPTYIKLGQILSLREDILPSSITDELKNLLDRLPVVAFPRLVEMVTASLGRPIDEMFASIDPQPLGSASIAQTHRAVTRDGDQVILKVVKPGIRATLTRDAVLLKMLGSVLQRLIPRYQPRRVIAEFVDYTLKEVDLRREADNAETFQANFRDESGIVFPRIYRKFSSEDVLCMEFFDGPKPNDPRVRSMSEADREKLVDYGACAIIRMLYKDGFFHADLHPGNLIVLPGPKAGFIDLGMVGRFSQDLRRTMLYYYYCLVMGDAENAAKYLASVAQPGRRADPKGFRREVEEISRRYSRHASFRDFSLARLVLESVGLAGRYRMYFPVEMVLMVKALVTYEGVGQLLKDDLDVASVSRKHIHKIFIGQFNPLALAKETLRGAPEMVDALVKAPLLVTEGLRFLEKTTSSPPENPLAGMRGTMIAGFSIVGASILIAMGGPWYAATALILFAALVALRRGE